MFLTITSRRGPCLALRCIQGPTSQGELRGHFKKSEIGRVFLAGFRPRQPVTLVTQRSTTGRNWNLISKPCRGRGLPGKTACALYGHMDRLKWFPLEGTPPQAGAANGPPFCFLWTLGHLGDAASNFLGSLYGNFCVNRKKSNKFTWKWRRRSPSDSNRICRIGR